MEGKVIAIMKLDSQFADPAMLVAAGLGPCANNSAIMNQGMGPENIHSI
jgi:hypothetical protein